MGMEVMFLAETSDCCNHTFLEEIRLMDAYF